MRPQISCRPRVAAQRIQACAIGLLLWACSAAPQGEDAASYRCEAPPADLAACSSDADCATVAIGCYCGPQPVNGVARRYAVAAQSCEDTAASTCALGCVNGPGLVAQDGNQAEIGATVAARCDHASSTFGVCKSYVPSAPVGPGDPPSGG